MAHIVQGDLKSMLNFFQFYPIKMNLFKLGFFLICNYIIVFRFYLHK